MIVFPNAKINIGLHVVSKRPDGYHNLETVFYPVQLFDALEMAETGKAGITFSGLPVEGPADENLVMKAYRILKKDFGLPPVQFHLHKNIPAGAGLGGGSSDAAFTLKMLNNYFKLQITSEKLKDYAAQLGADCSFFIDNKPAFAEGIGDLLSCVDIDLSQFHIVVLKPEISVSTAEAYRNVIPAQPVFKLEGLPAVPVDHWKDVVKNDFENSVFLRFPEIKRWKEKLFELGAIYASMSGSGSAVFGIFRHLPADLDKKIPKSILLVR
ncbi:MAG TPA: 4-(cytidine 5'-diphospho)-2-C-methyl-D-erythritol kinase [Mariniphaga anaerophila]|uniref:4-diphosphocytidyl-2-C-methyl-D-erythritol kinase n=1 Tax=Mariniphaga anaerophila TaxID=1484053 RepID=A0A831LKW1_9BACT|nr:4-(cytidine 5'-diphospho)-2-C-methyl-D-erythritol kinase [Mariniphaga anaerophila]